MRRGLQLARGLRLGRDRRAAAAVELALTLPVLLVVLGGLVDTGLLWRARGQLAAAVAAGAQYAVLAGVNATPGSVRTTVQSASTLPSVTATVSAWACYCVVTTSGVVSLTPPQQTCGPCPDGSASGSYMQISASYTYNPILPGISKMVATTRTEQAMVRLQ